MLAEWPSPLWVPLWARQADLSPIVLYAAMSPEVGFEVDFYPSLLILEHSSLSFPYDSTGDTNLHHLAIRLPVLVHTLFLFKFVS